jgi:hypothetical protein
VKGRLLLAIFLSGYSNTVFVVWIENIGLNWLLQSVMDEKCQAPFV